MSSHHIDEVKPGGILLVIPVAIVCKLSEQLYGRLGPIFLLGWHVQIIDKHQTLLPHGRTKHSLPATIQFGHDDFLSLASSGTSREVHSVWKIPK